MTETAVIIPQAVPAEAESPLLVVKALIDNLKALREQKAQLEADIEACSAELHTVAKSLMTQGVFTDGRYEMTYEMKERFAGIDIPKLAELHPDIYSQLYPHVTAFVALDILTGHFGGDKKAVQEMLRSVNPDLFDEKASINKGEVEAVLKQMPNKTAMMMQLKNENIIQTEMVAAGEPELHLAGFQAAKKIAAGKRAAARRLKAAEDEEDEE